MATPQLSPGVLIREVDLTVGRADNVLDNIGVIAGPFPKGPVDEPTDITTEQELINVFGKPLSLDGQYEYWMSASSFLSYGGVMKIVRTDSSESGAMVNANARRLRGGEVSGVGTVTNSVGIATTARTAGTYSVSESLYATSGNGTGAVFSVGVTTTSNVPTVTITNGGSGFSVNDTVTIPGTSIGGVGVGTTVSISFTVTDIYTTSGISTVGNATLKIKNFDNYQADHSDGIANYIFAAKNPGSWANNLKVCFIDDRADQILSVGSTFASTLTALTGAVQDGIGVGVSVALNDVVIPGAGSTSTFTGYLKGIVTGVQDNAVDVKIVGRVAAGSSTITPVDYKVRTNYASFRPGAVLRFTDDSGAPVGAAVTLSASASSVKDWYDQQTLDLTNGGTVYWRSIAPKPGTSQYVVDRNGKSDEIHVVVVDDTGEITGVQANLLEKHVGLSKAVDAISAVNSPTRIWWRDYLARYSNYVYVGDNPSDESSNEQVSPTGFSDLNAPWTDAESLWDQEAQDIIFSALGNATYTLKGGKDYTDAGPGETGTMKAELGDLITSYRLFGNDDEIAVDYLIMGPGCSDKFESQAKAAELIAIAGQRKDCMAVISPHRTDVVDVTSTDDQTDNVLEFFSPLPSSSYAVFDSGYKYTYDRFNNKFRYIPCNADVAGLMVRTSIFAYPWFSPAGQQRGILNNAIKLAYNPNKAQRDQLYPQRINAIVNKPGIGILLFGDKTGLGYASAFDRINVRRLFLTVEQALRKSAEAQLFELNDTITRANFVNIVEPYLRDVQAKRGLYGFLVVCDESNNTPDVIDNNEFRADIFLKPAKSINYVTLTFVATRTGVAFEEVVGTV